MTPDIVLRDVVDEDLPALFALQADPTGAAMAGFRSRDRPAFDAHWAKIRQDPTALLRTIVYDDRVVGNMLAFDMDGRREVGYWIDQTYWGRGVASTALALLLMVECRRPLYGHAPRTNTASRRVLERNGFAYLEEDGDGVVLILRQ